MGLRYVIAIAGALMLSACGGAERATIYLEQRLGPDGPPRQVAPVLAPAARTLHTGIATPYQVVQLVRQGPAAGEWKQGFVATIDRRTRVRSVSAIDSTATVELVGQEPDFYGSAAIVYSLTSLPGIDTVRLRLNGRACCVYAHGGRPIESLRAQTFDYWQGEPCAMRVETDAVQCRTS